MGTNFGLLLLLAILGLIAAEVNIIGTPEKVQVSWKPETGNTLKSVYITRGDKTIANVKAESLDKPTNVPVGYTVACKVSSDKSGQCTIDVNLTDITRDNANDKYGATITLTDAAGAQSAEIATNICVVGTATDPMILETKGKDSVDLNCTSQGVPAPTLYWTDAAGNEVTAGVTGAEYWNDATKRFVKWISFKVTNITTFYDYYCNAKQEKTERCKQHATTRNTNFVQEIKPEIKATQDKTKKSSEVKCEAHGVPAPTLSFIYESNPSQNYSKDVRTEGPTWDRKTNSLKVSIAMDMTDKKSVTCSAKQELGYATIIANSKLIEVNSAGKFDVPRVLMATIAAVLFTQSCRM